MFTLDYEHVELDLSFDYTEQAISMMDDYEAGALSWTLTNGDVVVVSDLTDMQILTILESLKLKERHTPIIDSWINVFNSELKQRGSAVY